jgi:tetratricopeptide (TPR) repeat protein
MSQAGSSRQEEEAFISFLEGFLGLPPSIETPPQSVRLDPVYEQGPLGDVKVLIPLDAWNGTAAFRPPSEHQCVLRLNFTTEDRHAAVRVLRDLGGIAQRFLFGIDRRRRDPAREEDDRGYGAVVFFGFGATFFRVAGTGAPRFGLTLPPRHIEQLNLDGAKDSTTDSDLYIVLESNVRALVLEGLKLVHGYAAQSGVLQLSDFAEGIRREDGRSILGFQFDQNNPTIETTPSAERVVLCTLDDEPPAFLYGTYVANVHYEVDVTAWSKLTTFEQEQLLGRSKATGDPISPLPRASLLGRVQRPSAPVILQRTLNSAYIGDDAQVESGLITQVFMRQPQQQFQRLYNDFLMGGDTGPLQLCTDRYLNLRRAGLYFVPNGFFSSYPGHQFFAPDVFEHFFVGLIQFEQTNYSKAIEAFRTAQQLDPTFEWGYIAEIRCFQDMGVHSQARAVLTRLAKVSPENFLYLERLSFQYYLEQDYNGAIEAAIRAVVSQPEDTFRAYAYHTWAASLLELARVPEAEQVIRRGVARVNLVVKNCFTLGNVLEIQGRIEEAQKIYDRTVEVAEYIIQRGWASLRDIRTNFDLAFIQHRSTGGEDTRRRVLASLRNATAYRKDLPTFTWPKG